ncbi:MAG: response regulator [Desulfuromonadaceae bacterium]|nr:response regulator [Desulfuromonadaceae bacterium]
MNILIVDDNIDDRNLLRCILQVHGHEVTEAVNGMKGLQSAFNHDLDLIISDVLMPVMDGFQFLRTLRETSSIPFIFYSAVYDSDRDMQLATSMGADGYLTKPMIPAQLMAEIERIMGEGPKERCGIIEENSQYLKRYSHVVATKLEEKVRELEEILTERTQIEQRLQQAYEFTGQIINSIPDPIFVKDRQHRFFLINNAFCSFTGHAHEELIGKSDQNFFPKEEADEYYGKDELVFNSDKANLNEESLTDATGNRHFIQTRKASFVAADGKEFLIGVIRDITEQKRAEHALLDKRQRLADMALELSMAEERERRRFATNLHDNIGQDLALTRINLGILAKAPLAVKECKILDNTQDIINGAIKKVRNLTHLISPPILESAGLEAALKWLGIQMETDYGLQILFKDDLSEKTVSKAIQAELYFAARELLINVAKHAKTETARIAVARKNDTLVISVEDDGIGFDQDFIEANLTREGGGFGLFNIRRRIIYLGGTFDVESAQGAGTRVTIGMPLKEKPAEG